MEFSFSPKRLVVAVAAALPLMASAADTPSTATARKGFAGYDHPNQYLVKPATTIADNMMPVMQHQAQDKETQQKLAELENAGKIKAVITQNIDGLHQAAGSHRKWPVACRSGEISAVCGLQKKTMELR